MSRAQSPSKGRSMSHNTALRPSEEAVAVAMLSSVSTGDCSIEEVSCRCTCAQTSRKIKSDDLNEQAKQHGQRSAISTLITTRLNTSCSRNLGGHCCLCKPGGNGLRDGKRRGAQCLSLNLCAVRQSDDYFTGMFPRFSPFCFICSLFLKQFIKQLIALADRIGSEGH